MRVNKNFLQSFKSSFFIEGQKLSFTTRSFGIFSRGPFLSNISKNKLSYNHNLFENKFNKFFTSDTSIEKFYTKSHEYLILDKQNSIVTLGISNVAVEQLGEVAYVELPEIGSIAKKGEVVLTVASVKAVGDVYSPLDGEVIEVNTSIDEDPSIVNNDPEDTGWLCKIKALNKDLDYEVLTQEQYNQFCESEESSHH